MPPSVHRPQVHGRAGGPAGGGEADAGAPQARRARGRPGARADEEGPANFPTHFPSSRLRSTRERFLARSFFNLSGFLRDCSPRKKEEKVDRGAELAKVAAGIAQGAELGELLMSAAPDALTETEAEYTVQCLRWHSPLTG